MKIGESVGHRPPARLFGASTKLVSNDVFIGLELELEGFNGLSTSKNDDKLRNTGLWVITEDGSLRDYGREFILQESGTGQPIMGKDIIRALDFFDSYLKGLEGPPTISERTSTHVHLDVRDLEEEELSRLTLLYYTFEDILFKWIGGDRVHNHYCRSASENPDVIRRTARLMGNDKIQRKVQYGNKYDAFNFRSIDYLGTVEIRSMGGTYDTTQILNWINILLRLRKACKDTSIKIQEFPEQVSTGGMKAFLEKVFDKQAELLLPHATDMDILRGVRTAQELLLSGIHPDHELSTAYDTGETSTESADLYKTTTMGEV